MGAPKVSVQRAAVMSITLSPAAAERVRRFLERRGEAVGMRLAVKPTGCSGYAYQVAIAERVEDGDRIFESEGVRIVVDAETLALVDGTHIDFAREGLNEGFRYHNPNVKSLCGCGESFGV